MTYRTILNFTEKLTLRKIFNIVKILIAYFCSIVLKKSILWGFPAALSVETSGKCNLRCSECPTGNNQLTREKAIIDSNIYFKLIDELCLTLSHLFLYFQGEPFLNPELFILIKYATDRNIYTAISTNGHFLSTENIEKIIKSGLNKIIISLDGFTKETYEKYRIGGNYQLVITGIKKLTNAKKEFKANHLEIIVQFIVFGFNEHEMSQCKQIEHELGVDQIIFKTAQIYNFSNAQTLIPKNTKFSRYKKSKNGSYQLKRKITNRCFRIWHTAVCTGTGEIVPCCFDKNADYVFGNVNDKTLHEIWHSKTFNSFRKDILINRHAIKVCNNCAQ